MSVVASIGFFRRIIACLLKGNNVHVPIIIDIAGNEGGKVGYLKGWGSRDLRPFVSCRSKGCKIGHSLACVFICGGVLNCITETTGHDVLVSVIVQIYGDRSAVLKTPFLRDKFGTVRSRSGERRSNDGVVQHHKVATSELHRADIHQSCLYAFRTIVGMKDDAKDAFLVVEERMMPSSYEVVPTTQNGIARVLRPSACSDVVCVSITYGIILAAIVVAGIGEIITPIVFDDVWTLVYAPHLVLPIL